ncbi:PREDICTED: angiogenic factor with G patch and FHA domains 1 [Polistes canadensis]|uniref:angiogenic factor with G patch and FHA domains 1 n=1 Tax=Polistes canadensis TaxID=91411 RepID=UPI000718AC6D|nr:PREDICTED: angiogenic factor with G patch and FHA domains 1 [Polistes canadensis]
MMDHGTQSESDEGEIKSDFGEDLDEELQSLPHVLQLIRKMRENIKWQRKKIEKLRNKLQEQKNRNQMRNKSFIEYGTQTDPLECENKSLTLNWDLSNNTKSNSLVEQVKQVAESALLQNGFVYEETSGLYYDYSTGYYYDAKQGLYYDGNYGLYYYYDESSKTFKFHSHAHAVENNIAHSQEIKMEEKSDSKKANKDTVKKRKLAQDGEKLRDESEEGECSDSDSEQSSCNITPELSTNSETDNEEERDIAKTYPPCMRIIVKETSLPKLKVGSLFFVSYTGGSMGKEGDHSVIIPDINVSKYHARFLYNEKTNSYWIVDSGSRNGTYLNGKRLSVAKQESESYEIVHGSIIQVGNTKLLCHIHNGNETCGHCEPGLVQHNANTEENVFSRKNIHKQELRRLKTKFGVEKDNATSASQLATGYRDRAQARRQRVGSSNHHAKTEQSSIETSIAKDNRGFKLLSKMGWSEGRSLGKDGDGRTEPIAISNNPNKSGFGAVEADFPKIELDSNVEKKQARWRKTQQRYNQIIE